MTQKNTRRGFTLIELLVVVLIIGILAAVAVSRYQKVIIKSKYTMMVAISEKLAQALEMYYLENGTYPGDSLRVLDISFPDCTDDGLGAGQMVCNKDIYFDYDGWNAGDFYIRACYQKPVTSCDWINKLLYTQYLKYSKNNPGKKICNGAWCRKI